MLDYVQAVAGHVKAQHPALETFCCVPPEDRELWPALAGVADLDNLGTDLYWANDTHDPEEMRPLVRELAGLCLAQGKRHHQWLQCWGVRRGNEGRVGQLGEVLAGERPDALYVWAFEGQVGTSETCADPARAWQQACAVLRRVADSS